MTIRDLVPSFLHKQNNGNDAPFLPIETLKEEMDHLFDNFYPRTMRATQNRLERSCGSFRRSFYLPTEIKEDDMAAKFKKGVLSITLPKSQKAQKAQKKIEVKAA